MCIAIVSDTHFPMRGSGLPSRCRERLAAADLIIHAGDHCTVESLHVLTGIGPPARAVHGNVDNRAVRAALPDAIELQLHGFRIAVIHDVGPARGRHDRVRRRFPCADVVIFGHSHIPITQDTDHGLLLVNPGSPTDRRRQPHHTMAELLLTPGCPPAAAIVIVDPDDGPTGQND